MNNQKPFWMPDTQGFLAIAIVLIVGIVIILLLSAKLNLSDTAASLLQVGLGFLFGCFKDVYSFFFGSSKGSEKKDDALISGSISPTSTPPIVPPAQAITTDAAKALGIVAVMVLGALLLFPQQASAAPFKATGNFVGDFATATGKKTTNTTDQLTKVMNDIAAVNADVISSTITDINLADQDAATLLNPSDPTSFRDPISHACYPAEVKFLQSLPTAAAPTGKYVLVQLFQRKRDFVAQLQAGIPPYLKLGCSALLGDEAQILIKSLGIVGVTVGANLLIPGSSALLPALPALTL